MKNDRTRSPYWSVTMAESGNKKTCPHDENSEFLEKWECDMLAKTECIVLIPSSEIYLIYLEILSVFL